jgi:hypothetical protein
MPNLLTEHEIDIDAKGRECLIVRCKDKNGIALPCFALLLDRHLLERTYQLPLVFSMEIPAHLVQSNI